jgi:hypothetical protein
MALAPAIFVKPPAELFVACHWKSNGGVPKAVTLNVTGLPATDVCETGWVVITGLVNTVKVAGELVTETLPLEMIT